MKRKAREFWISWPVPFSHHSLPIAYVDRTGAEIRGSGRWAEKKRGMDSCPEHEIIHVREVLPPRRRK